MHWRSSIDNLRLSSLRRLCQCHPRTLEPRGPRDPSLTRRSHCRPRRGRPTRSKRDRFGVRLERYSLQGPGWWPRFGPTNGGI